MTDPQPNQRKNLSEISHLFLSDVRDNVSGGVRPRRLPPGAPRPATDEPIQRPVEPAPQVAATEHADPVAEPKATAKQVAALIVAHLNGSALERAKQYARHLSASGSRIGLLELSGAELRLSCFDRSNPAAEDFAHPADCTEVCDIRHATEMLAELAWDVDRWLVLLSDTRPVEARQLLAAVPHWVLLSTCDHDGVVSCYRSIKGLSGIGGKRPRLSLALLNATGEEESRRVHRKIAGVCQQFLNWPLEAEPAVPPVEALERIVSEHRVLMCRPSASESGTSLWHMAGEFLNQSSAEPAHPVSTHDVAEPTQPDALEFPTEPAPQVECTRAVEPAQDRWREHPLRITPALSPLRETVEPATQPQKPVVETPKTVEPMAAQPAVAIAQPMESAGEETEVTELPAGQDGEAGVLAAVLSQASLGLVASPVKAPAAPQAVLAIGRDRRLVLLAVARQGLSELKALGQAYRWVIENRPLIAMALPQFAIDAHAMPALRLLVDRRDLSAEQLQPLLQTGNVIVQTYRKLRWGPKTGLLLEAA